MSAEWLEEAVRAARDVPSASAQEAARTRRKVLAALGGGSRWRTARALSRRRGSWLVLAVAAVLFAGVCAAATGTPARIAARLGLARRASDEAVVTRLATKPTALPTAPARPSAPVLPLEPPSAAPVATSVVPPSRAVTPGPDPQALYAQAHALHFHGSDPARALAAWDRYLAVASQDIRGGLVLEARYNRAICLFRLGQREQARQALQPFADGRWGAYRRDDAQALLDDLGK